MRDRRPLLPAEAAELRRRGVDPAGVCCDGEGRTWRLGTRRRRWVPLPWMQAAIARAGLRAVWDGRAG